MEENASENPNKVFEVHQALEDGDLVAIHGKVRHKPEDFGTALVHIFRFQGDRIVELWDLGSGNPGGITQQERNVLILSTWNR